MRVIIDCGTCSEPHLFDQVEGAFVLRRAADGSLLLSPFAAGRFVLAYFPPEELNPKLNSYHELYNSEFFTRQELEAVAWGINHLATHFPGRKTPNDIKHMVHMVVGQHDDNDN